MATRAQIDRLALRIEALGRSEGPPRMSSWTRQRRRNRPCSRTGLGPAAGWHNHVHPHRRSTITGMPREGAFGWLDG